MTVVSAKSHFRLMLTMLTSVVLVLCSSSRGDIYTYMEHCSDERVTDFISDVVALLCGVLCIRVMHWLKCFRLWFSYVNVDFGTFCRYFCYSLVIL